MLIFVAYTKIQIVKTQHVLMKISTISDSRYAFCSGITTWELTSVKTANSMQNSVQTRSCVPAASRKSVEPSTVHQFLQD